MLSVVSVFSSCVIKLNIIVGWKKMNLKQMVEHVYRLQSFTTNMYLLSTKLLLRNTWVTVD